jgi:hypothetical protein
MLAALILAPVLALAATEVRRLPAGEANQGVVGEGETVVGIGNHSLARMEVASGRTLARWSGDPARFPHLNSCVRFRAEFLCAASNYPAVPMASRIERFDAKTLAHRGSQPLAFSEGSLTWMVRHRRGWWAGFANYDGKGGVTGRDHRATTLVRYDLHWREKQRWRFPETVLAGFAPRSASGGAWGDDGLLYVTGHDRPELYALRVPRTDAVLEHAATIAVPFPGQAISWDGKEKRLIWGIDRKGKMLVASRVPALPKEVRE